MLLSLLAVCKKRKEHKNWGGGVGGGGLKLIGVKLMLNVSVIYEIN